MKLIIKNICKSYSDTRVLNNVSLCLNQGEIISILGTSGCGKTTLLNIISGIDSPDSGKIILDDSDITAKPGLISYMLQKDMLLPHLNIIDNVCLPLRIKGVARDKAYSQAKPLFNLFGLSETEKRYPHQLSGGMRQRAALLRTYMFSNKVALLDEPFSAMDSITKSQIHKWYLNLVDSIELSTIFITHDIDEALLLSDRIYILGSISGTIEDEIYITEKRQLRNNNTLLSKKFIDIKKHIIQSMS